MTLNTDNISVEIINLKEDPDYEKCIRCNKYEPKHIINEDPFFPKVCRRCASVLHTMHYDVAIGNTDMLPPKLRNMTLDEFEENFVRAEKQQLDKWKREIGIEI